ncbi:MFS transporter [Paraburkholderia diazotrophica]|uniref:Sugar phosphate permease n=1 Tax=Paraburkholderia diazotrophica TaxID=667676 RepID=A0A1H7D1B7_9BURK|nr:MFS transporter [Paraburkholderia diazotrophica]SEJ91905.1 Sugar phosphate permease [Paraburkholderia diazotrophica]
MTRTKSMKTLSEFTISDLPAYRWVVLTLAWLALLFAFVDRLAWANLAVKVGGSLGLPVAGLGAFVTAFYIGYVVSNALGGLGTDRFGSSRMLSYALIPLGLTTFAFSYTTSTLMGLVIQVLMGLAAGADYSACVKLTATWFDFKLRGRAMGLLTTASSVGVVLTNAAVPYLSSVAGWEGVYRILGSLTAGVGLLCLVILRDANIPAVATSVETPTLRSLAKNRDLILLAIVGFGALWGTWGFAFWVNALIVKGHGLSAAQAGVIAAMFGAGAIFSKPLVGLVSDLLGGKRKLILIICFACFAAALLLFGSLHTEQQFMLAAPFLGVTAFIYTPLIVAMVAEIAGPKLVGSAYGFTNAFWQLGSVIVPVVIGIVFQLTNSFSMAFVALAAGPALATVAMFWVKERHLF